MSDLKQLTAKLIEFRDARNRAHPAFPGRRIYVRSDARLICYELLK